MQSDIAKKMPHHQDIQRVTEYDMELENGKWEKKMRQLKEELKSHTLTFQRKTRKKFTRRYTCRSQKKRMDSVEELSEDQEELSEIPKTTNSPTETFQKELNVIKESFTQEIMTKDNFMNELMEGEPQQRGCRPSTATSVSALDQLDVRRPGVIVLPPKVKRRFQEVHRKTPTGTEEAKVKEDKELLPQQSRCPREKVKDSSSISACDQQVVRRPGLIVLPPEVRRRFQEAHRKTPAGTEEAKVNEDEELLTQQSHCPQEKGQDSLSISACDQQVVRCPGMTVLPAQVKRRRRGARRKTASVAKVNDNEELRPQQSHHPREAQNVPEQNEEELKNERWQEKMCRLKEQLKRHTLTFQREHIKQDRNGYMDTLEELDEETEELSESPMPNATEDSSTQEKMSKEDLMDELMKVKILFQETMAAAKNDLRQQVEEAMTSWKEMEEKYTREKQPPPEEDSSHKDPTTKEDSDNTDVINVQVLEDKTCLKRPNKIALQKKENGWWDNTRSWIRRSFQASVRMGGWYGF